MTDFNQEPYDRWMDAMKAREYKIAQDDHRMFCHQSNLVQDYRNADRLAAYKRRHIAHLVDSGWGLLA